MPRILLADADAFFVAVARMVDPDGAGKAALLIVGGTPEGRGVVCSASYETRKFGVRSAMPTARAIRLCPQALVVPVPGAACSRKSREIRAVLHRFSPVVRAASIDEWYLDLSGTEALYGHEPLDATAHRIRDAVRAETGLSVSFGGGSNKLIAKLAVEFAKPKPGSGASGVHVVPEGGEIAFMRRVALADIPGIGPKTQERLAAHELRTVPDVLALDQPTLVRWFGEREAEWLWRRCHGLHEDAVTEREPQKQVSREDTFARDVGDDRALEGELRRLAGRVAADLRGDRLTARTVTVKIKDFDFRIRSARRTVPEPFESDRAVEEIAVPLLRKLRRARRVPARLLGVALSGLAAAEERQLGLFDAAAGPPGSGVSPENEKDRKVSHLMDALRSRFGADAVKRGRT